MSNITPYVQREVIPKERIQLVKDMIMKGASDSELDLFVTNCNRTGLDPMQKQCWAVKRWDSSLGREVFSFQTGVDGFRIVANRSGKYSGQLGPYWCGENGEWKDVWLSDKPPVAAKVGVLKEDFKEPLWAVAKFSSYAAKKKDGSLTPFWLKMPDLMIAKVAECLALRKAFPQDLSGVYGQEEMEQAEDLKDVTPKQTTTASKIEPKKEKENEKKSDQKASEKENGNGANYGNSSDGKADPVNDGKQSSDNAGSRIGNAANNVKISKDQSHQLFKVGDRNGWTLEEMSHHLYKKYNILKWSEMNQEQYSDTWALFGVKK
jgi:phage recombination protein Bet